METISSKPLVILGSARSDGNTSRAVNLLFSKNSDFDLCDLQEFVIQPYSYVTEPKDDFLPLVDLILKHSILVFATPVYWYAMSGVMKVFLDRWTDLITRHKSKGRALAGKKTFLIATGGGENMPEGFEIPFQMTSQYLGMIYEGGLYWGFRGTEVVAQPSDLDSSRLKLIQH
jgi:putative NADPH-quinone reductase